ncbi:MAG: hypothetical protein R3324_14195 [Halobacteriales archaeon]|nr:hypothetical protein [Halobacteriales archaeon]
MTDSTHRIYVGVPGAAPEPLRGLYAHGDCVFDLPPEIDGRQTLTEPGTPQPGDECFVCGDVHTGTEG